MANVQLPNTTFKEWAKDPKTAMLILMASLLTVFVYSFTHTSNSRVDDCKEQINYLRKEITDMSEDVVQHREDSVSMLRINNKTIYLMDSLLRANTKGAEKLIQ